TYMPDEWIFASAVSRLSPEADLARQVNAYATSTWTFTYWQRYLSDLVGRGLFGLRVTSAVIGALTVGAAGWLAWELFDRRRETVQVLSMGVAVAWVLLCFSPHVHYSRLALYNIVDPLFGLAAAALILRGLHTGERLAYVGGGVMLGLSQYFYEAGKLLFIPLFAVWFIALLIQHRQRVQRGLALAVVAAVIVGSVPWVPPLVNGQRANTRLRTGSIISDYRGQPFDRAVSYVQNLPETLLMVTTTPDGVHAPYFAGSQGLVASWWLPFFAVGMVVLLARPLRGRHLLILLWLGGTLAGTALLREQTTPRYVIVLPILAMICVVGIEATLRAIPFSERGRRLLGLTLLGLLGLGSLFHYFAYHIPNLNAVRNQQEQGSHYDVDDLAVRMANVPDGNEVVVIAREHTAVVSTRVFEEWMQFFNPTISAQRITTDDEFEARIWLLPDTTDLTFFIRRDAVSVLQLLEQYYVLSAPGYTTNDGVSEIALVQFDVVGVRAQAGPPPDLEFTD
ncbi:MAG: glucosyltransferase domain-containing protein, partial [Chloroflexota bacterium]